MRTLIKTLVLGVGLTFLAPAAMADDPPDAPKKVKKAPKKVVKKAPKKVVKKAPKKAPKKDQEEN